MYAGDNFTRGSGDTASMQKLQLFSWQAEARGSGAADLHMQANPTVNELQYKQFQQRKEDMLSKNRESILDRYGGAEHFESVPKEIVQGGQSEAYVEYSRTGQVIKGQERAKARSKYEEDVLEQNHTTVWGSWYDLDGSGQWGYRCCHSTIRGSYCTGKAGIEASKASNALTFGKAAADASTSAAPVELGKADEPPGSAAKAKSKEKSRKRSTSFDSASSYPSYSSQSDSDRGSDRRRSKGRRSSSHRKRRKNRTGSASETDEPNREPGYTSRKQLGEGDIDAKLDRSKLKAALAEEGRRQAALRKAKTSSVEADEKPEWLQEAERINNRKGGRAGFNSLKADDGNVTEEQLEAYRLKKPVYDDPMANYKDDDDV